MVEIASDILEKHDSEGTENFDSLYGFKRALEETRNGIQEIASHKTVIIVVDELDRCLPMYSIGRTFFWLSILYKNIEKQPFILYPQATSAATKLVEQFAEIIDIIDVD